MKFGTSTQSDMLNKIKFISSFKNAPKSYFWIGVLIRSPLLAIVMQIREFEINRKLKSLSHDAWERV